MGFSNQTTQQQFPFSAEEVFSALDEAVKQSDMTIQESDSILKRATISAGVSLLSWGETVSISVHNQSEDSCVVVLDSSLKFSANLAGSHKHQKNFDKILYSLSRILNKEKNTPADEPIVLDEQKEKTTGIDPNHALIGAAIIFVIITMLIIGAS
jgi:hypothetical protein